MSTPQQFLQSTPRGAYTTMLVRDGRLLVDWETHLERLVRSLRALHASLHGFYSKYYAWLEAGETPEAPALQQLLAPAIQAALAQHVQAATQYLMLIIVLPPAPDLPSGLGVCVHAHVCALPGSTPGSAVVLGGPRSVPVGKDSGWVLERQPLEEQKPGGAAEVLLCTQDGRLLEGLVTNLFVVADAVRGDSSSDSEGQDNAEHSGNASEAGSSSAEAPLVIWTAGMQDGVVWGTVRARLLEVCRKMGIAVREEAPSMRDRVTWREAFLTNSLRLVQPLSSISCADGNLWGHQPWERQLPQAPGPITAALHAALLEALPTTDAAKL